MTASGLNLFSIIYSQRPYQGNLEERAKKTDRQSWPEPNFRVKLGEIR